MHLVVGLGNPGSKYARTRHNVGFDVVEMLADRLNVTISKLKCKALLAEAKVGSERVVIAQPQTFMNLSGESVVELANWYKVPVENIIICYDDIDLELGALRVRAKGSAGTHNGMRSIVGLLGKDNFPRVRVGIGRPAPGWDLVDHVLSGYRTPAERELAFGGYQDAVDVILELIAHGTEAATRLAGDKNAVRYPKEAKPKKEKKNGDKINFSDIGRHSWERIRANRLAAVACCIHVEGKSAFQGMFGSADIAMNDKPRKETLYPIDVLNMPVAAVAALMMKERGQLDPDAPIRDGLSARALLRENTPDALDALTAHIGTLANLPFEQFVQIMLFEPLKMKEAAYAPTEVQRLRTAQRYTVENDALLPVDAPALPALHGTLTDAMRFVQMIANGGELDGVRILEADNAALLLPLLTDEPVLSIHKGGTYLHVDPERKLCAVYLTNMVDAADAAEEFRTDMLAALKK